MCIPHGLSLSADILIFFNLYLPQCGFVVRSFNYVDRCDEHIGPLSTLLLFVCVNIKKSLLL